jgi:hypothetical protein
VRILLDSRATAEGGVSLDDATRELGAREEAAGRPKVDVRFVQELLEELANEGFCKLNGTIWSCA